MRIYQIDRQIQIRHFSDLSVLNGREPITELSLSVPWAEEFVLQLAVLPEEEREIWSISFRGDVPMTCINTQITDKFGQSFEKHVPLYKNHIRPLFFILHTNPAKSGETVNTEILLQTEKGVQTVALTVQYTDGVVENLGYNELWRLSRLNWLNSTRFLDNAPVLPYFAPVVRENTVEILGRKILFGENGLPKQMLSYFDESISVKEDIQKTLFANPMEFSVAGAPVAWSSLKIAQPDGTVLITADGIADGIKLQTQTKLFYEGFLDCSVFVTAEKDFYTENITLSATLQPDCADYMNGLGAVGSAAHNLSFCWDAEQHLDCLYVGAVNAGLRLKWKAENYRKPLVNIYYHNLPLLLPTETWDNHQKGTITFTKRQNGAEIAAETGCFSMQAGEVRRFDFEIHFTPLKEIDYRKHYAVRYDHSNHLTDEYKELRRAEKYRLTHMVIHHGNGVHPFINYPFIETARLKNLVDAAKEKNIGVKVYYTTREHSNHMAEVFAYKALDDEIILRKKGEGYSWHGGTAKWLTTYFGEEIIPAWKVEYRRGKYKNDPDVSFIVRPNSRLDNYYIEGLDWLVQNIGIQGIYIDDTALDRTTITRARKVLSQTDGLIDMHMWNHEEARAGNVSCMNLYTELFPFLDSLWIGEGYPYKKLSPEYLLTEVSGIPYGQTSQMLEGGGNPYIGMLYAMNNRYGWGAKDAPRIYQLWDDFGIQDSEMRGYWHSKNPVRSSDNAVKATVYLKKTEALVCLFNFSDTKTTFRLYFQPELLGFAPKTAERVHIKGMQRRKVLSLQKEITLRPKDGLIFFVRA